jgi:hypothetical protein
VRPEDRISFRAHFERFPASVKGAFVLRSADPDPHQLRLDEARVAECAGRGRFPLGVEPSVLDVAPTLDLFVPFEFPTTELDPGWYRLECDVAIDGTPATVHPGERFAMPWPRSAVRRGAASVDRRVGGVRLGRLECGGDSLRIGYEAEVAPGVRLTIDGRVHPVLDVDHDEQGGRGTIVAYPALRDDERLAIEIRGEDAVEVALP